MEERCGPLQLQRFLYTIAVPGKDSLRIRIDLSLLHGPEPGPVRILPNLLDLIACSRDDIIGVPFQDLLQSNRLHIAFYRGGRIPPPPPR